MHRPELPQQSDETPWKKRCRKSGRGEPQARCRECGGDESRPRGNSICWSLRRHEGHPVCLSSRKLSPGPLARGAGDPEKGAQLSLPMQI